MFPVKRISEYYAYADMHEISLLTDHGGGCVHCLYALPCQVRNEAFHAAVCRVSIID